MNKRIKRIFLTSAFAILGGSFAFAESVALSNFKLLNNNENSAVIANEEAQSLLNVDVTPGGKSVKKRSGYGLYKALSTGQPIHGGYHFFDSTGNDVQIWGSSTSLYGIVSDGTPTQLISSATLNSTWDCADTQGNAYCVNSNRNMLTRTNGATQTWFTTPLGTMVEVTPDRLVVAGVSGTPNTLYISESNNFTNFTTGIAATSPFTEVIASPGSKLTHIRWACGKLLWWKDQSFGWADFEDQYSMDIKIISDTIGTFDNASAVDPSGRVWFRGQDGHAWSYDCSGLEKMSIPITPNVQASGKRVANSWTQTSQSDWQAGSVTPTNGLSTTILDGAVVPSSITLTDTSSADFAQGTGDSGLDSTSVSGALTLKTWLSDSFSNMNNWTQRCGTIGTSSNYADFQSANTAFESASSLSPSGNFILQLSVSDTAASASNEELYVGVLTAGATVGYSIRIKAVSSGSTYNGTIYKEDNWNNGSVTCNSPGTSGSTSLNSGTLGSYDTSQHTVRLVRNNSTGAMDLYWDGVLKFSATDSTYTTGFDKVYIGGIEATAIGHWHVDDLYLTARQGNFTSRVFDTTFSTPTYGPFSASTLGNGSYAYAYRASNLSGSGYSSDTVITSGSRISNADKKRYIIYSSTLSATSPTSLPQVTDISIVAASTGTFYSQVKNSPNLTGWSTISGNVQNNGGSHSFYVRASTNSFTTLSSTPTWVSQTLNSVITASTGTYLQVKDDFSVTSGTDTPTLYDFTLNWFEGSASDQAYMLYFDNAIWYGVAFGAGQSVNNYIFKYDLINDGWTLYNIGSGGLLAQANSLYFGSTSAGNIYKFGSGTSDAGSNITAYWKSKDFVGQDPWLQNEYKQLDSYWVRNANQTSSMTYTLDGQGTGTTFTVNLSSTTKSIISNMKLLPPGKIGQLFNVQVGDTSDASQWEFLGFRMGYSPQPYRPTQ